VHSRCSLNGSIPAGAHSMAVYQQVLTQWQYTSRCSLNGSIPGGGHSMAVFQEVSACCRCLPGQAWEDPQPMACSWPPMMSDRTSIPGAFIVQEPQSSTTTPVCTALPVATLVVGPGCWSCMCSALPAAGPSPPPSTGAGLGGHALCNT
jgi:hypothetical protein